MTKSGTPNGGEHGRVQFAILASGSRGNATLVRGAGPGVLIDAGLGPRALRERLESVGAGWSSVAALVLTHTHGDHVDSGTFAELARRGLVLYCHEGHRPALAREAGFQQLEEAGLVSCYEEDRPFLTATGVRLEPIALSHDGGPTFGFRIEVSGARRARPVSVGYLADTGSWSEQMADALADVDALGIEFNHDVAMQRSSGRSWVLIRRNLGDRGHLSNHQGAGLVEAVLRRSRRGALQHLVLLHLSQQCNQPDLAIAAARSAIRGSGRRVAVHAARQSPAHPNLWIRAGRRPGLVAASRPGASSSAGPVSARRGPAPVLAGLFDEPERPGDPAGGALTVAYYFASDVHLREDHPDRDRRFRRWLAERTPDDSLIILGDFCDFWMGARQSERRLAEYPSLRALAEFRRRGGALSIMAGNHDQWLCSFYERALGAEILAEPADRAIHGIRVRMVHGHRLGARRLWKAGMESLAFFRAFGAMPGPFADPLDRVLTWKNERGLLADEERHLRVYRDYAASLRHEVDLVVIGHVHRAVDEPGDGPRLIVLGGWQHRSSYLKIDEAGANFRVIPEPAPGRTSPLDGGASPAPSPLPADRALPADMDIQNL